MLDSKEVQHIARLARIGLTPEEEAKFQRDLSRVFDLIEELKEAKLDTLETIGSERETNRTREDGAIESGMSVIIQKNFPQNKDGFNKVKAVF